MDAVQPEQKRSILTDYLKALLSSLIVSTLLTLYFRSVGMFRNTLMFTSTVVSLVSFCFAVSFVLVALKAMWKYKGGAK